MKILVADKIAASGVEYLQNHTDFEVIEAYESSPETILELVKGQSIRLVQAGPYARIHVKLGSHHEED